MYYQKTNILQLKSGQKYKNIHRLQGGAMKMVPEILRWCWKVKKMVPCHSKTGHGTLLKIYLFKANTNNHISEKYMVFRMQDGQEYLSIKFVRVTIIFHYPGLIL